MRVLLIFFFIFILNSCLSKKLPPLNYYQINYNFNIFEPKYSKYKNKIIKVSIPLSLTHPLDYKIYYNYGNGNSGKYINSQWEIALYKQLENKFINILNRAKIFKAVIPSQSNVFEDLRLETTIYEFENKIIDNKSYAIIDIEFRLIDMKNRDIIKQKRFKVIKEAKELNAKSYVDVLNKALDELGLKLINWIIK